MNPQQSPLDRAFSQLHATIKTVSRLRNYTDAWRSTATGNQKIYLENLRTELTKTLESADRAGIAYAALNAASFKAPEAKRGPRKLSEGCSVSMKDGPIRETWLKTLDNSDDINYLKVAKVVDSNVVLNVVRDGQTFSLGIVPRRVLKVK